MKHYLKEIILGIIVTLLLAFAIIAFNTITKREQATLSTNLTAIPPHNAQALIAINRPELFRRMIISETQVRNTFATHISPIFIQLLHDLQLQAAQITIHPQGQLACLQTGRETTNAERYIRQKIFNAYPPQEHIRNNITFHFFPTETNKFFGYYVHNNILVCSHSRKLLEAAAQRHTADAAPLPPENIARKLKEIDANAPANIIFRARANSPLATVQQPEPWIAADIFAGEGNICLHARLPANPPLQADQITAYLATLIPEIPLALQSSDDPTNSSITACWQKKP